MDEDEVGILFMWKCLYANVNEPVERKKLTLSAEGRSCSTKSPRTEEMGSRAQAESYKAAETTMHVTRVTHMVQLVHFVSRKMVEIQSDFFCSQRSLRYIH